jgi:diguanylate cyclase (GGDEF)-like protein/PAS domain S-box-containing protein
VVSLEVKQAGLGYGGGSPTEPVAARLLLGRLAQLPGHLLSITSASGEVVYVSPSVVQTLGYTPDEFLRDVRALVHPDDLDAATQAWNKVIDDTDAEVSLKLRLRHADGSWRHIHARGVNAMGVPGVRGVLWNHRDITPQLELDRERTAGEERLRAMLEQTYDVFLVLDRDLTITWANARVHGVMGYEPAEVLGTNVLDHVHPEDHELAAGSLSRAFNGDPPGDPTVVRGRHRDGTWVWLDVVGANLLEDPNVDGFVLCLREVTSRQEAELARRAAEQRVSRSEERFRALVQNAADVVLVLSTDGLIEYVSPQSKIFGRPATELIGHWALELVHQDDLAATSETLRRVVTAELPAAVHTFRVLAADRQWRWAEARVTNMLENPAVAGIVVNVADVTDRVEAERNAGRLLQIFQATDDLVGVIDAHGSLSHLNRAAREFLGLDLEGALPPLKVSSFFAGRELERLDQEVLPALHRDGAWSGELEILDNLGRQLPALVQLLAHRDPSGATQYYSIVMRDISERKAFEERLEHQATHDPLTGLPNRTLLLDRLTMALARARRRNSLVAVLFLDLDHFKVINDSLGHSVGDDLLAAIATRLSTVLRPNDTVARFGGDEFVVLCEDLEQEHDSIPVAERIQRTLDDPFTIGATEIFVGVSIGISSFVATRAPEGRGEVTPETLLREADTAMYGAKERGRGNIALFDETLRSRSRHRLDTETALRRALDRSELEVHYQPIIDLATSRVRHLEALVRWEHPERGPLLPAEFVGVAEETGLIVAIGRHVLETACRDLARWQAEHVDAEEVHVSVNLSGRQLAHAGLVDDLQRVSETTGLPARCIMLEMTESLLMDDVEFSDQTLARLKRLDVKLAVDDFGTGYSSLSCLQRFPVDVLKIDRSFVSGLGTEGGDEAIVTAIIRLAHTLGLEAVAEGVENPTQLARLRALGCNMAQGYYLARPAPAAEVFSRLRRFGA